MKKLFALLLAVVLAVGCLAGVCFAADPIAVVTNGTEETEVFSAAEIKAFINPDGKTVVKMLKDDIVEGASWIYGVPTFTLNLNGHSVGSTTNNAVTVKTLGTENHITHIYGGTIIAGNRTVRIYEGALRLENVTGITGNVSFNIGLSQTSGKWNADNLITGCTLICNTAAPMAYDYENMDSRAVSMKIENTTIVAGNPSGNLVFSCGSGTDSGSWELGKGVKIYTCNYRYVNQTKVTITGEKPTQTAKGTATYELAEYDIKAAKLNIWETAEWDGPTSTTPETPEVEVADFADVAKDFWGYAAIMNAAKAGLVKGKSTNADGTMNYVPNASMTRAEFITVICRYFYPTEAAVVTAGVTWWSGYYDLAIAKGILQATELDGGAMDKAMSREEMALVLSRTAPAQAAYASVTPADSAKIPDYASVGEYYQNAVLWAYGAGLLKGVDTVGTFNPKGELNRAAVATIFNTLLGSK